MYFINSLIEANVSLKDTVYFSLGLKNNLLWVKKESLHYDYIIEGFKITRQILLLLVSYMYIIKATEGTSELPLQTQNDQRNILNHLLPPAAQVNHCVEMHVNLPNSSIAFLNLSQPIQKPHTKLYYIQRNHIFESIVKIYTTQWYFCFGILSAQDMIKPKINKSRGA